MVWAEANATRFRVREAAKRKKDDCRAVVRTFRAKRQCTAAGRKFALSLTAGAPPRSGAEQVLRARFFV